MIPEIAVYTRQALANYRMVRVYRIQFRQTFAGCFMATFLPQDGDIGQCEKQAGGSVRLD